MGAKQGDLTVTALYTSQTWAWGGLSYAALFATPEGKRVFDATNAALAAASLFKRGLAPLRVSLLHRHTMIDHLLRESGYRHVLELAAGLSRRGAAFSEDERMRYTEIDLPHVVAKKRELLARSDEGRAVLTRPGLRFAGGDLENLDLEQFALRGAPLFVIAEGLMMYLAAEARQRLFARVRRLAEVSGELRFVFDLVPRSEEPAPGAVGRLLEAAMKTFTGGRTFERDAHTREQILRELRAAGFEEATPISSNDVAAAWGLPHAGEKTKMVLFACATRASLPATPS